MNHASDRSKKIKLRRFDFFDYVSIAVNVLSAIFLFVVDVISTSGSRFVLVTYLIFFSYVLDRCKATTFTNL